MNKFLFKILTGFLFIACFSMELSYSASNQRIYSETDPRLFEQGQHIVINKSDKKIKSPGKTWTWYNSWHVTRRQPGVLKTAEGGGPYTLTNSFDYHDFEELTWAHYSFYVFRSPIRESYDCNISEIEGKIWKELKQSARIIRIDKLDKNFYVVTYVRSDHKKFELEEVDGYPPFNMSENIRISDQAIHFDVKVKSLDPYGRAIFTYQPMKMLVRDILLLNPAFLRRPAEMEDVVVPYGFFAQKFIYEHPGIANHARKTGDPMVVKITPKGIVVRFYKQPAYEEL
jgi:hypothetical protein